MCNVGATVHLLGKRLLQNCDSAALHQTGFALSIGLYRRDSAGSGSPMTNGNCSGAGKIRAVRANESYVSARLFV